MVTRRNTLILPLRSPRLQLRVPSVKDLAAYHRILSAPRVIRTTVPRQPWTRKRVREFILARRREAREGSRFDLAVELRTTSKVIGRVALKGLGDPHPRCEIAYWFDPAEWGKGLASEAVRTACSAAFRQLRVHRVDAAVFAFNDRSIALLRRLGFRHEGTHREALLYRGRWVDEERFGLLRGELRSQERKGSPR